MARIVFHSAGYWGDVVPYVPIANVLSDRGHDVVYALPRGHHALLRDERFSVADSGNPFSPDVVAGDAKHARLVARNGVRLGGALTGRYYVNEWVLPYLRDNVTALLAIGDGADVFVTHSTAGTTTRIAADALGVPFVTGSLFPMIVETTGMLPRPLHGLVGLAVGDRAINALRRELGVPTIEFNATQAAVHDGMLLLWSEAFAPRTRHWDPSWVATGFTLWDGPGGAPLDPAVDAFLSSGDPPVVVTLGSSAALVGHDLLAAIAQRLDRHDVRAMYLTGGDANVPPAMRGRPDVFSFAPLTKVLPRAAAIVHAGGHGTNAAALTAGVPSVIVPFLIDQLWNAKRAAKLGVGVAVRGHRRRADRVARAVTRVRDADAAFARRARALAASMAGEDGVATAADLIERSLN